MINRTNFHENKTKFQQGFVIFAGIYYCRLIIKKKIIKKKKNEKQKKTTTIFKGVEV